MKKETKDLPMTPLMMRNLDFVLGPYVNELDHEEIKRMNWRLEKCVLRLPVAVADKLVARYKELLAQLQADREAAKMWDGPQLRLFKKENHFIIENL